MIVRLVKIIFASFLIALINITYSYSDIVKQIDVDGNERISDETVKLFSKINVDDKLDETDLNKIIENLYETNFFKDISIKFLDNILTIKVVENPIIENIEYRGIKTNRVLDVLKEDPLIKERSSFNKIILKKEKSRLLTILRNFGYINSELDIYVDEKKNNLLDLIYEFKLGKRAKIKKITFVGNKNFKDSKLRRIITSTEYKYWKFISGRKFLNESIVDFDKKLLANFYKNNGYYNVEINSSFAKLIDDNEFELLFNINANPKVFFGELILNLPSDFDKNNFTKINKMFEKLKGEPYSINSIDKILKEIDLITSQEQYQFINANVIENLIDNKLNLEFEILETEKFYVEKINIFGNNITSENVIRNQFEIDEGDPYNEILLNKSINNIKSLNFFKKVEKKIIDKKTTKTKIVNISVEEKPTGEIAASAGIGTTGGSFGFSIKENNFLGNGIKLDSNFTVSTGSLKGKFSVTNPNFNNTDKLLYLSAEALEIDNYSSYGYKTNKTGFSIGTNFEYLDDFFLGVGNSHFYEKIETNSTASARQRAQEGNYWDSFLNLDFNYDKRNQKFQTTSGFRSFYSLDLPILSETNSLKNYYSHAYYFELYEKNISNISFFLESVNSLNNKNVKLSERINIPSRRLRGFETGKIGPKDGDDYIGGNFAYTLNFSSTLPQILEESQNVDILIFADVADIWGVDYNSSLNNSKVRSSVGIGLDWFSPVGPMNFSLSQPITKANSDITESFRFNLGTTF
ncbi:outer membrane protein assembly factor BamA [Candidatus Pelagibacter sp. HIMB1623]|uniref:outer membrane protein assembly factor BamA n=1 Tax=Candidatus Pelagibacter sp. HIMB1623 TaxID=3413358 RepID=UPI003F8719B8